MNKIVHIPPNFPDSTIWPKEFIGPACCKDCPAHPINGGTEFCDCDFPLYDRDYKPIKSTISEETYYINYD